jgi:hypothetical protein
VQERRKLNGQAMRDSTQRTHAEVSRSLSVVPVSGGNDVIASSQSTRNSIGRFPFQRHRCRRDRAINESPAAYDFASLFGMDRPSSPSSLRQFATIPCGSAVQYSTRRTSDLLSDGVAELSRVKTTVKSLKK